MASKLHPRARGTLVAAGAALLLSTAVPSSAAPPALARSGARTADELADLARFQERIDAVLARALPATVGVRVGRTSGSGVIVSADGLVLSAAHVAGAAGRPATVVLQDGTELAAQTLGVSHARDGAMLRIRDAAELPHVSVPGPHASQVGEWCLSIGHPGGYEDARPPVPRLGRILDLRGPFLQTDCPIISGDSGGPLFDLDGRLVGIHSRIEGDVAVNYHVPMSAFRLGWRRMLAGEEWSRGEAGLGVLITGADPGARIELVADGLPAHAAGLREGDVVRVLNGEAVRGRDDLVRYLGDFMPGDEVELELVRDELAFRVRVTLARLPVEEER